MTPERLGLDAVKQDVLLALSDGPQDMTEVEVAAAGGNWDPLPGPDVRRDVRAGVRELLDAGLVCVRLSDAAGEVRGATDSEAAAALDGALSAPWWFEVTAGGRALVDEAVARLQDRLGPPAGRVLAGWLIHGPVLLHDLFDALGDATAADCRGMRDLLDALEATGLVVVPTRPASDGRWDPWAEIELTPEARQSTRLFASSSFGQRPS